MNVLVTPEWQSAAFVTIDTQCDTLDGQPLEIQGTSAALPAMQLLTESFRKNGRPIIHIVRIFLDDWIMEEANGIERRVGSVPISLSSGFGDSHE